MTEKRIRSRSLNLEALPPNNQFQGTSPLRGVAQPRVRPTEKPPKGAFHSINRAGLNFKEEDDEKTIKKPNLGKWTASPLHVILTTVRRI